MNLLPDMDPYELLDIPCGSSVEEIRAAYRRKIKTCHPDLFTDPDRRIAAQRETVILNLAYEEALSISSRNSSSVKLLSLKEAKESARRLLEKKQPEKAMVQLCRSDRKDAEWFCIQGDILMQTKQYEKAHASYREAVSREPDNQVFREGALRSAVALKKSKTFFGKITELFK